MKKEALNRGWAFQKGTPMYMQVLATGSFGKTVNLPHDYMIESDVREDAPAGPAMGYFTEGVATYTKELEIPSEWEGEKIYLHFDGSMAQNSESHRVRAGTDTAGNNKISEPWSAYQESGIRLSIDCTAPFWVRILKKPTSDDPLYPAISFIAGRTSQGNRSA